MKKILILTCNTGEGHNSAARAIQSALINNGNFCELIDPVVFKGEKAQELVSACYNNLIKKAPSVFGAVYRLGDWYSSTSLPSPVYWANASYAELLERYITEKQFDAVICTHLYGMEAMTAILQKSPSLVPCYGVLTDYTCIPFTSDTKLHGYFVAHEGMQQDFVNRGFPKEAIRVSGIPVNPAFAEPVCKNTARKKLGFRPNQKIYLLMTGGIGCENMMQLCKEMIPSLEMDSLLVVMTGRNEKMKQELNKNYADIPQLVIVPFTPKVHLYMAAADVLISKPGGLSSTEAAIANIPLVHVNAIPGCETCNARFFSEHGMSLWAKNNSQAIRFAQLLADDPSRSQKMCAAQRKYCYPHAAQMIAQEICEK